LGEVIRPLLTVISVPHEENVEKSLEGCDNVKPEKKLLNYFLQLHQNHESIIILKHLSIKQTAFKKY